MKDICKPSPCTKNTDGAPSVRQLSRCNRFSIGASLSEAFR